MDHRSPAESIKLASNKIATSIGPALNGLQWMVTTIDSENEYGRVYWILVHKLRVLRTFFLCSTILRRTEITRSKNLMLKLRVVLRRSLLCSDVSDTSLTSVFVKVEGFISRILNGRPILSSNLLDEFSNLFNIDSIEEEMDTWYKILSDYLQQGSASPVLLANEVHDIIDCIAENLANPWSFPGPSDVGVLEQDIVVLKKNIISWKDFISFFTLICSGECQHLQLIILSCCFQKFKYCTLLVPAKQRGVDFWMQLFMQLHMSATYLSSFAFACSSISLDLTCSSALFYARFSRIQAGDKLPGFSYILVFSLYAVQDSNHLFLICMIYQYPLMDSFTSSAENLDLVKAPDLNPNAHEFTPLSIRNKMASKIIDSITDAVKNMRYSRECYYEYEDKIYLRLLMHKLMGLRTFVLCLKKLGNEDTSFTYPSVEEPQESNHLETKSHSTDTNSSVSQGPDSHPLEYVFNMIENSFVDSENNYYDNHLYSIESLEEEIDQCYTSLSEYLPRASSSPRADEVEEIFTSVLQNLEDFLSLHIAYDGVFVAPVEALKMNIIFWRNFLRFSTLLGTHQPHDFLDLLVNMEVLAFSAAHFTVHIFSSGHYNARIFSEAALNLGANYCHGSVYTEPDDNYQGISYGRIESTISALLLRINPLHNPHLYESYTRALESMKCSYVPNLDIQGSIDLLLSILWEVLQLHTGPAAALKDEFQEMYQGLRYLRALLKKHLHKFDGEVGAVTKAGIFDAGVVILSVYQNHDSFIHGFEDFRGTMKMIRSKVEGEEVNTSKFNFPKTTALAFLDFISNYLMEIKSSNDDPDTLGCVRKLGDHLLFLKSFVEKLVKLENQFEELYKADWNFAMEVAYKMEVLIDQMVLGDIRDSDLMSLQSITEDMMIIKTDSEKIFYQVPQEVVSTDDDWVVPQRSIPSTDEFVGFKDERISIIDRLTRESKKLQVVAIVGMPGLGKTTLATKVYNEPIVQHHFQVRAWCSISQEFSKRKVLLELLNQISQNDYSKNTVDDLAHKLRQSLLGRKYLIYIDDVWEIKAFECLKPSFPDGSCGRILLTSRSGDLAELDIDRPYLLRQLSFSESLELLQMKASIGKDWPQSLYKIAVKIAENCKGIPLIIVIVAGLLVTTKQEVWEEVLVSLTSGIISSTDQCHRTIELSYKHLPEHLKPCLLSFGAFPEDEEISVKRLIWLWIAEGFVRKIDLSSLEEVAAGYLNNLIGRSLVMDGKKRTGGGIKTCRIHDLLLDFCLRKANEENFIHLVNGKDEFFPLEEPRSMRRLCVHSKMEDFMDLKLYCPRLRSLSFFGEKTCDEVNDISFIFRIFKLLRVFNMENVRFLSYDFPGEMGALFRLRYLAITVFSVIPPSIGNLSNLETFIIQPVYEALIAMPDTFWNLRKLRHLFLNYKEVEDELHGIILPIDNHDNSCKFLELESLTGLHSEHWSSMENQLRNFPNIRRLKCWLYEFEKDGFDGNKIMSFAFLSRLESLSLLIDEVTIEFEFSFPKNIKKLSLSGCNLSWEKISIIAELPNLEVLKLHNECFIGDEWQMEEGEFTKLRFLKLERMDVISWTGRDDQFPNLEKLVMISCSHLEEIPECLENVETLEMIEVISCSDRVECLVEGLAVYLKDRGNSFLQVHVHGTKKMDFTREPGSADEDGEDSAIEEDENSANEEDGDSANEEEEDSS